MVRRHGDVRRISRGLSWERHAFDQSRRQVRDATRHVQRRYARQKSGSRRGRLRVSCRGLIDYHLRHVQVERSPSRSPPCVRALLASRHDDVATLTPREIMKTLVST